MNERLGLSRFPFQAEMEAAFGEDFSAVTVRVDATGLGELGAAAANEGDTLVLPSASPDRETVAHELTHVVQRRRHGTGAAKVSDVADTAEREAESVAGRAARGEPVQVRHGASARTMRKAVDGGSAYNVDPKEKNTHPGTLSDGSKDYTRIEKTERGNGIRTEYTTHLYDNLGTSLGRVAKGTDVRLNAGQRRDVRIDGKEQPCLLVFSVPDADTGAHRTGWMKAAALPDSVSSSSYNPTIGGKHCAVTDARYEVADTECPQEYEDLYVYPSQDGHENKAKYYFHRKGVVNFLLNLPHSGGGRYGSARDVLAPGTGIRRAEKASERVPLYAKNSRTEVGYLTFVYARTGDRFGWINHDCLKKTS